MRAWLWSLVAAWATRPGVLAWLIARGVATPYTHITSADGLDTYMLRYWLFNPYGKDATGEPTPPRWTWLPSVRLHCILRADSDRDLHNHPWDARTIVLGGFYEEEREGDNFNQGDYLRVLEVDGVTAYREVFRRETGYTGPLLFNQYHRITEVSPGGVWTMFFTWKKQGSWGFKVNGKLVPWREYLGIK